MGASHFVERCACPVCGGTDREVLYDRAYEASPIREFLDAFYPPPGGVDHTVVAGGRYVLDACRTCGLVYQRQVLDEAATAKLYETWIDPGRARELARPTRDRVFAYAAEMLAMLHHFGKEPPDIHVLDFGMGFGDYCRMARGFGFDVAGVEISDTRVALAEASGIAVLPWDSIPEDRFDFIHAEQVFEHLTEPLPALRRLVAALADGGLVKISVPDGRGIRERIAHGDFQAPKGHRHSLNAVSPLEHVNCFTPDALVALAARAGLRPTRFSLTAELGASVGPRPMRAFASAWIRPVRHVLGRRTTTVLFARR